MNTIVLVGRVATDVEIKYTPGGKSVCDFRLAIDRFTRNAGGEWEAGFLTIQAWERVAENAVNYLTKGKPVVVTGRLQNRQWIAQDGTKRDKYEVTAERIDFVPGGPRDGEGGDAPGGARAEGGEPQPYGGGRAAPAPQAARAAAPAAPAAQDEPDFGDPFADQ